MDKLGVSFGGGGGGGPSRKELLETVELQRAQLLRYQTRLKDLVRAYRSVLKEKEALEASLQVLSASPEPGAGLGGGATLVLGAAGAGAGPGEDGGDAPSEDGAGTAAGSAGVRGDPGGAEEEEEEEEEESATAIAAAASPSRSEETSGSESGVSCSSGDLPAAAAAAGPGEADKRLLQLKTQLATLTGALATVAQEKSRMEASYQADKRKMKQEMEEAGRRAAAEAGVLGAALAEAQQQLAETRARLAAQQRDRAQEQSDHAVMLHELQRLLQSERSLRQEAEWSLEEAREALGAGAGAAERAEDSERRAGQLSRELEALSGELRALRERSGQPSPQLRELQAEMAALRSHVQAQLLQEVRKTAQAEERVQMEEQRVASLEAQISEMSELLGTYEKSKQKDQMAIQKLKERIVQLDLENKTLAIAAAGRSPMDAAIEENSLDITLLKDKMEVLRRLLQAAAKDSPSARDTEAFCQMEAGDGEKATAAYYQQELKQLKEEFERYKLRAQVVLKSKSAKDGNLAKELEDAQEQLAELREKYVSLRLSCEEVARQHQDAMEAKRQEVTRLQQLHRQEMERAQADYREKVLQLEGEMHRQRDRVLAILAEKDQELEQLRAVPCGPRGPLPGPGPGPQAGCGGGQDLAGADSLESLPQALALAAPSEPAFLLYTEQLARKGVEVLALKKQRRKLETEVHRLQERLLEEEERHKEEVSALQDHIQKNFRDQCREGANLEYLKNIFYRFLTLTDLLGRQQTLTAILTILHFSPEEKQAVLSHSGSSSWWHSAKR
ncbi:GRIP and coiled-coil domain-containing protein 1 [Varanus komodoensis]|uniref:GRIP and coiled-coil domain-containing protein 1 n=1 Tax=Varanus komodoensis TaxID=61221 RepID=A0A8D2LSZ4_VARKO|nr:GRIP and coiled-coil domain-containing protein 1 [Varanus komodoensis]